MNTSNFSDLIKESLAKLKNYCEREDFKGWDPFDGLNCPLFSKSPFSKSSFFKLFWIQLFKRNPVNLREVFLINKDYNPKALALFLSGYCNLYAINQEKENLSKIEFLLKKILELQSHGFSGKCWGYNFDWQSRSFFVPKFTPNLIVSTFIGNALIDTYQVTDDEEKLKLARSVCDFILNDLNRRFDNKGNFCFSYTPLDKTAIFNASLLASRFLSRVYSYTEERILLDNARKSVEFCAKHQSKDGFWFYGLDNNQKWIDSFHTGYNLEAIYEYENYSKDTQYNDIFKKGLKYYLDTFFTKNNLAKYYHNSLYPIDIHSISQALILIAKMSFPKENINLVENLLKWATEYMQDEKGYFYYQKKRYYTIKIPYLRWSCAWMFYALALYLKKIKRHPLGKKQEDALIT